MTEASHVEAHSANQPHSAGIAQGSHSHDNESDAADDEEDDEEDAYSSGGESLEGEALDLKLQRIVRCFLLAHVSISDPLIRSVFFKDCTNKRYATPPYIYSIIADLLQASSPESKLLRGLTALQNTRYAQLHVDNQNLKKMVADLVAITSAQSLPPGPVNAMNGEVKHPSTEVKHRSPLKTALAVSGKSFCLQFCTDMQL